MPNCTRVIARFELPCRATVAGLSTWRHEHFEGLHPQCTEAPNSTFNALKQFFFCKLLQTYDIVQMLIINNFHRVIAFKNVFVIDILWKKK